MMSGAALLCHSSEEVCALLSRRCRRADDIHFNWYVGFVFWCFVLFFFFFFLFLSKAFAFLNATQKRCAHDLSGVVVSAERASLLARLVRGLSDGIVLCIYWLGPCMLWACVVCVGGINTVWCRHAFPDRYATLGTMRDVG